MTTSARETLLEALKDWLADAAAPATVTRDDGLPDVVPPDGLVQFDDGDPGEAERVLNSATPYEWNHRIELQIFAETGDHAERRGQADEIGAAIGAAIKADHTLGGLVDWCEPGPPTTDRIPVEGGEPVHVLSVTLTLVYSTASPLT